MNISLIKETVLSPAGQKVLLGAGGVIALTIITKYCFKAVKRKKLSNLKKEENINKADSNSKNTVDSVLQTLRTKLNEQDIKFTDKINQLSEEEVVSEIIKEFIKLGYIETNNQSVLHS